MPYEEEKNFPEEEEKTFNKPSKTHELGTIEKNGVGEYKTINILESPLSQCL
jgi:hypothetical protein